MQKFLFIIFITFCSCSNNDEHKKYLKDIGINLTERYTILQNESSSAIGDYSITFDLKISYKDYETIIKKIKNTENYIELNEKNFPDSKSSFSNLDHITAYKSGTKYFYNIEKANTNEYYSLILLPKNILSLTYAQD